MAINGFSWIAHRRHREQVIHDDGQWLGLLDEEGYPIMDLPQPLVLSAPETKNTVTSATITIPVYSKAGILHPAVEELVAGKLGVTGPDARLAPVLSGTRFIAVERPGYRRVYRVVIARAHGGAESPETLEIGAVGLLDYLAALPMMSLPDSWRTGSWDTLAGDETENTFSQPREIREIQLANETHIPVLAGPADTTITELISRSLVAAAIAANLDRKAFAVRRGEPAGSSPRVVINPQDGLMLDDLTVIANSAGVRLSAEMVWPGDPGAREPEPVICFTVTQEALTNE